MSIRCMAFREMIAQRLSAKRPDHVRSRGTSRFPRTLRPVRASGADRNAARWAIVDRTMDLRLIRAALLNRLS